MTQAELLKALEIIRSIDLGEFADVGLSAWMWSEFKADPPRWLLAHRDEHGAAVWAIIERRMEAA